MKKIKLNEMVTTDTSSTTSSSSSMPTNTTSRPGVNINIKKKDLADTSVQQNLGKLKSANVNIVSEEEDAITKPTSLTYISDIKDSKSGKISEPFNINGKKYQIVRAMTPDNKKVLGVYSYDDVDDKGENIIYDEKYFEETIANKAKDGEPNEDVAESKDSEQKPSFAGFKHFIVNRKTGKSRKFKSIDELAKANMGEGEEYMGLKNFKKFVDETLFGSGKKTMKEDDVQPNTPQDPNKVQLQGKAQQLMGLIKKAIPADVLKSIATPVAQQEVIGAFIQLLGVNKNNLNTILDGIRQMASGTATTPVNESRNTITVIKVKDLKK